MQAISKKPSAKHGKQDIPAGNTKRTYFFILAYATLLLLLPALLFSCKKKVLEEPSDINPCTDTTTYFRYADSTYKQFITFTGTDTLRFIRSNTNDTLTFLGAKPVSGFSNANKYIGSCIERHKLGFEYYSFNSSTYPKPIAFGIYAPNADAPYRINMTLDTWYYEDSLNCLGPPYDLASRHIRGKLYTNLELLSDYSNPADTSYYACYSATYGLVQIKLRSGEYWDLIPKP